MRRGRRLTGGWHVIPGGFQRGVRWLRAHKWIWVLALAVALAGLVWWGWDVLEATVGIRHAFSLLATTLKNFAAAMGPWGPLLIILALASHSIVIVFPMEIPTLAAFGLYGPLGGLAVVWVGSMVTASISFMLGRLIGPPILRRWANQPRIQAVAEAVGHLNPLALILLRWISFIPFDVLNMIFGTCQVPVFRFAWTTAVGVLATNLVTALLYRTAVHAHWGQLVLLMASVFILGWGLYWWANRTHLKRLNRAPDDIDA